MRRIDGEELRKIQLEILDVVAAFCEENGISYWLDCGTLLGAIRHKGYIPWDDDIDIGMLRPDYDRFLSLFNGASDRYQVCHYELDNGFMYPLAKILDTKTLLYEPDENGNKLSVNIDLFVYDNAPDDDREVARMYARRDRAQILHLMRNSLLPDKGLLYRKVCLKLAAWVLRVVPKDYYIRKMINNTKSFAKEKTGRVGNFTSYAKIVCDKSVLESTVFAEFEGKQYRVPAQYDTWLRLFYKDYMQLPPKEKQVSHHMFVAYVDEDQE